MRERCKFWQQNSDKLWGWAEIHNLFSWYYGCLKKILNVFLRMHTLQSRMNYLQHTLEKWKMTYPYLTL